MSSWHHHVFTYPGQKLRASLLYFVSNFQSVTWLLCWSYPLDVSLFSFYSFCLSNSAFLAWLWQWFFPYSWNLAFSIFFHILKVNSVAQSFPTLCDLVNCSTPGFPVHHQLPELTQTHVHRVGDAIQPSHPLLSPSPLTFNLSQHQGLLQWVSSLHQVAKYWSFIFNISPFNEYSELISFRMDWLDLLAVQRTFKSLFQHHSSKASILQHSAFSIVSHIHIWLLEKP